LKRKEKKNYKTTKAQKSLLFPSSFVSTRFMRKDTTEPQQVIFNEAKVHVH
jgi:hypothetical protein